MVKKPAMDFLRCKEVMIGLWFKGIGLQTFTCTVLDKQDFRKLNTLQHFL